MSATHKDFIHNSDSKSIFRFHISLYISQCQNLGVVNKNEVKLGFGF